MKKYVLYNKKLGIIYLLVSLIVYFAVTTIYQLYALITEITNSMDHGQAYSVILYSIVILTILFVMLIITALIKRTILSEISCQIRSDIYKKILKLDNISFRKEKSSFYTSMLVNDVTILEETYFSNVYELVSDLIQLAVMLFSIALIGIPYLLVVLIASIPSIIQPILLKKRLATQGGQVSEKLQRYTEKVKEHINSFELIKSFERNLVFSKIFSQTTENLEITKKTLNFTKVINATLMLVAVYSLKIGSQLYFSYGAINGIITVATVSLLFGLANNVGNPISSILSYLEPINSTADIRCKIKHFIDNEELIESSDGEILSNDIVKIEFDNLSFGYSEDNKILNDISLCFESSKKYALMGESGCGKSTIMKLIQGDYDNYTGKITINNIDVKNIQKSSIREKIALIPQTPYVFEGSLKDNMTLYNSIFSDFEIEKAIEKASLGDLYSRLDKGMDSKISNETVSGGEKQRIAVARAILASRKVILSDEVTSALDNLIAIEIENMILSLKDTMSISIAHRINETIKCYDCIYYIEDGKVCESGNFEQLMRLKGRFYNMVSKEGGINGVETKELFA